MNVKYMSEYNGHTHFFELKSVVVLNVKGFAMAILHNALSTGSTNACNYANLPTMSFIFDMLSKL